jgi:hypothetical protein
MKCNRIKNRTPYEQTCDAASKFKKHTFDAESKQDRIDRIIDEKAQRYEDGMDLFTGQKLDDGSDT